MDPAQPRLLLTGFEPFGGAAQNPSADVARALHGRSVGTVQVVSLVLPCVFGQSLSWLRAALLEHRPRLVLALGQAAGRAELSIERVAVNLDDARIADNAGAQPVDEPVVRGAPAAYFSTLPIKAMAAALQQAGYPAGVSHSAGSFVCNHVFYGLQHALAGSAVRSGFMHLPLLPEQAAQQGGGPGLPLQTQIDGVALALQVALQTREDARHSTGTLS